MKSENRNISVLQVFRTVTDKNIAALDTFLSIDTNGNLIIENFRKLVEYDSNKISLNAGGKLIYVYGDNLKILSFVKNELQVEGNITKIEFFEVK